MAYTRPDLANLRMESHSFDLPRSSLSPNLSETVTPPKSPAPTKTTAVTTRTATPPVPPQERSNNPYLSPTTSRSASPPNAPQEKSNNPYISNNPWLSNSITGSTGSRSPTSASPRPDLTRLTSYSLDLPRPNPPRPNVDPTAPAKSESATKESDSIGAAFGLGELKDLHEFVEYTVWNASLTNMRVCPADLSSGQYFYIAHRSFLPNRPGVVVHSGSTKEGPVLGVAHLDYFSTSNSLGVGDPTSAPVEVVWEKLHKESFWTHMRYSFSWDVDVERKGLKEVERPVFEWHRTKNNWIWDDQGDLVLVQRGKEDEVLAIYEGKGPLGQLPGKRRGTLKIKEKGEGVKEGWEMFVLLCWASIVELSRRRARQRRVSTIFGHI